ncbi:SCAR-like protein 2 isoform X2 [Solanum dulcamara]|uniref:SCAR-like protein 2 isoform X2 n=1 Tax=Solanum dulcamara TaxID=45834 RepID=UPI00248614D2|nr:SCAR-like protein 2 isoform X2 [Solanum dulcamara]
MPLVRTAVRNVYGLGTPELYRDAEKEDPKAVLDGVAVAGLVGILRQLGDLAEFAAEVFHGLQEQVMVTSSRSNKLVARVQNIEAALPPLEKSVLAQRSHLHFAYTAGSNWHARIRSEQNHFIYNDLPRFIMDSYEECHGPPHLHLLDKFDPGGPGSCLKRYSDPTFFKRASIGSDEEYIAKVLKEKKGRKIKKKRSWRRNGEVSRSTSMPNYGSRMQFSSRNLDRRPSWVQSFSTYDTTLKSDIDLRHGSVLKECVSQPSFSIQPEDGKSETVSSPIKMQHNQSFDYSFLEEKSDHAYNDIDNDFSQELTDLVSTSVAWNLKMQPDTQESKGSFDSTSQLHLNNMLDHTFPEERCEVVYDDIGNIVSKEQASHCTSSVTWNDETGREKQESRESFSSPSQIHHDDLPDCASPDRKGDDEYSDIGNNLTEDQIGRNLLSVALSGKMRTAEVESKEIFYSPLQMNPSASIEDASPDEKLWVISDEESNNFPQGQVVPSSPFLSSSVKNEQLDLIIQKYDFDESLETCQENLLLDTQVLDLATSENIEQKSSEPEAEIIQRSISYESQFDDIESETDNFMDALNTIESESETDLDCHRKQAMELESSLKTESSLNGTRGNRAELSDRNLSTPTPEAAARNSPENCGFGGKTNLASADSDPGAFSFSDKVKCEEIPENISSGFGEFLSSPQIARITLKPDSSIGVPSSKRSNNLEASQEEPLLSNRISSSPRNPGSALPVVNKIHCGPSDSEKPPPQLLGTPKVKFWTNGGLLGLEPSKPPDGVINSVGQVYEANQNEVLVTSRQDPVPSSEKHAGKQDDVQNTSREKADCQNSGQAVAFSIKNISSRFSAKDLDVKLGKSSNLYQQNFTDKPLHSSLNGSGMTSRTMGPVNPESLTIAAGQENGKNSSRILELGNRLLTNGFHGKLSLGWNDNTDSASSLNTGSNELINDYQQCVGRTIKDFPGRGSPFTSPSSSPPLGHMKISFQPIDSIETTKLKLRFPDRSNIHESNSDTFPSFQLVPEPSIPLQEVGSDSDDDTYSRSSPDLSDDYLSHQSESNSEQWESGNSPNLKDQELYNALHRMSLTESTSTSYENGQTAHQDLHACSRRHSPFAEYSLEDCQSDNLFDLPVLDTQHSSFKHGVGNATSARDFLEPLSGTESTPPPPPLPPMQWQSMQSHLDDEQDDLHLYSENRHVFDHKEPVSTIPNQPKPPPFKQNQVIEAAFTLKSKPHSMDTTGQQFADHAENGRGINEKEDFLHQIRAKSFNLRRTAPAKPTGSTGPPANVKVTAILEKANAIRQAVGSDDGEDNWSDT